MTVVILLFLPLNPVPDASLDQEDPDYHYNSGDDNRYAGVTSLIKHATTKEVIFCINFLIRRVVKVGVEKVKRTKI